MVDPDELQDRLVQSTHHCVRLSRYCAFETQELLATTEAAIARALSSIRRSDDLIRRSRLLAIGSFAGPEKIHLSENGAQPATPSDAPADKGVF